MAPTRSENWQRIKDWTDERIKLLQQGNMTMITTSAGNIANDQLVPFNATSGSTPIFTNINDREKHYGADILPTSDWGWEY
jgi:hypothetical protein